MHRTDSKKLRSFAFVLVEHCMVKSFGTQSLSILFSEPTYSATYNNTADISSTKAAARMPFWTFSRTRQQLKADRQSVLSLWPRLLCHLQEGTPPAACLGSLDPVRAQRSLWFCGTHSHWWVGLGVCAVGGISNLEVPKMLASCYHSFKKLLPARNLPIGRRLSNMVRCSIDMSHGPKTGQSPLPIVYTVFLQLLEPGPGITSADGS